MHSYCAAKHRRGGLLLLLAAVFIALLLIVGIAEATEPLMEPCDAHGPSSGLPSVDRHAACCLVGSATVGWSYTFAPQTSTCPEDPKAVLRTQTGTVFRL